MTLSRRLRKKGTFRLCVNKGCDGSLWYLHHHGVCNPNKPGKVRVVFDCACQWKGVSLNKELLQGPDLTSSLIGVLLSFVRNQ